MNMFLLVSVQNTIHLLLLVLEHTTNLHMLYNNQHTGKYTMYLQTLNLIHILSIIDINVSIIKDARDRGSIREHVSFILR